jgi:hypothetical protein
LFECNPKNLKAFFKISLLAKTLARRSIDKYEFQFYDPFHDDEKALSQIKFMFRGFSKKVFFLFTLGLSKQTFVASRAFMIKNLRNHIQSILRQNK